MFPRWIENSIYGAGSSPVTDCEAVYETVDGEYRSRRTVARDRAFRENRRRALDQGPWVRPRWVCHASHLRRRLSQAAADDHVQDAGQLRDGGRRRGVAAEGARLPANPQSDRGERQAVCHRWHRRGPTAAYKLRPDAAPEELWIIWQKADVSSPVLYRGRLFTISTIGVMVRYDAETGRVVWRQRVGSGPGGFYASLVAADGKIYAPRFERHYSRDCGRRRIPLYLGVVVARRCSPRRRLRRTVFCCGQWRHFTVSATASVRLSHPVEWEVGSQSHSRLLVAQLSSSASCAITQHALQAQVGSAATASGYTLRDRGGPGRGGDGLPYDRTMPVALTPGMRLGPYEIVAPSARAGWARSIAPAIRGWIGRSRSKSCPPRSLGRPGSRALRREARAISALNHPASCAV